MDKKIKLTFSDPLRWVIEFENNSNAITPIEQVVVSRLYARFKNELKKVSCWFAVHENSNTPIFYADKDNLKGNVITDLVKYGSEIKTSKLQDFYVYYSENQDVVLVGMDTNTEAPALWIEFTPVNKEGAFLFQELHTYIEGLKKLYWIAKLHRLAYIKNITQDVNESLTKLSHIPQSFSEFDYRVELLYWVQNQSLQGKKEEPRFQNRNVKFNLKYLSWANVEIDGDVDIGGLIDWAIYPQSDRQIEDILSHLGKDSRKHRLSPKQRYLLSFVDSELLREWLTDETKHYLLEIWSDYVLNQVTVLKELNRSNLILWFCLRVVVLLINNRSHKEAERIIKEAAEVIEKVHFLANELNRQLYFEQLKLRYETKPMRIAENLLSLIELFLSHKLDLHIPYNLFQRLSAFWRSDKTHEYQQLGELFQHNIDIFLFGLFMLKQEVNVEQAHRYRLADYINRQADGIGLEISELGEEVLRSFAITALFHDLAMENDLLSKNIYSGKECIEHIEVFAEREFINSTECESMKRDYHHMMHHHSVVSAVTVLTELEESNHKVPSKYRISTQLIKKIVRSILLHSFVHVRPKCRQENDPTLALLVFCDGIFDWFPRKSVMKSVMERSHDRIAFALPISATVSQFKSIDWDLVTLESERTLSAIAIEKNLLRVKFNEDIDQVKAFLTLVQMMGRLKHISKWCPVIRLEFDSPEQEELTANLAREFIDKVLDQVQEQEPQLKLFVEDWVESLSNVNGLIGRDYIILKSGNSYFGRIDVHSLFLSDDPSCKD